jgi:type I restriction enzyme S subunit
VAINTVPMATNQGFKSFVPKPGELDANYLYHWLRANRRFLEGLGNGATFKEVSKAVVSRVQIALPSVPEQRRIADILDKADAIRRKRKQAIALTDDLLHSAFLDMFGDPVTNPKGWPVRELNDFIADDRPITYGILKPGPDMVDGVPYIRVVDIRDGCVHSGNVRRTTRQIDHEYRRSRLRSGDLLMSIRGHVGRLAVVPPELENANITQDTARIAPVGLNAAYLMHLLQTPATQFWMSRHVRGVAVRGINIGDVRRIPVPEPPPDKQHAFAVLVRGVLSVRGAGRRFLASSEELFASLTQRAFHDSMPRELAC